MANWMEAVRRELQRYRRRTATSEFEIEQFYRQALPRVESQFPGSSTHKASIRKQLQDLAEKGEIDRIDDGRYKILTVNIDEESLGSVTAEGEQILEQWQQVASTYASGEYFDLDGLYDIQGLRADAETFIENPKEETFVSFWDRLNSAVRNGSGPKIYAKWTETYGREPEALAELIDEIQTAESYNDDWEDRVGAKWTVRELYGRLHIEEAPSITGKTARGLELFGYPYPSTYEEARTYFEDFKIDYLEICGRASLGTSHEAPENIEIDQLLRVIDGVNSDALDDFEGPEEVKELYELIVSQRRMATPAMIGPKPRELGLSYVLGEIASRYPTKDEISSDDGDQTLANYPRLQGWLKSEAEAVIKEIVATTDLDYTIRAGMGQGSLAYDPFIGIFDSNHTTSTQRGLYIVYLFDPAAEEVYLTLNQGADEATKTSRCGTSGTDTYDILELSAKMYRKDLKAPQDRFEFSPAKLSNDTSKARKYNSGTICHQHYTKADLTPDSEEVNRADLTTITESYKQLLSDIEQDPKIELSDGRFWRIGPGERGRLWPAWEQAGVASVGFGQHDLEAIREASEETRDSWQSQSGEQQLYDFVTKVETGDMVVAGSKKDKLRRVYGIGIVTNGFDETDAEDIKSSYDGDIELNHERLIRVNWYPVADSGLPIMITTEKQVFNHWTLDELTAQQTQKVGAAVCRKLSILNAEETPSSVATKLKRQLNLNKGNSVGGPELPDIEDPATAPFYWVNQSDGKAPITAEYLQQDLDERWSHNLTKLKPDDVVFNYHDGELLGYSTVESKAYIATVGNEPKQRVDVEFTPFEEPIPLTELYPIFIQDKYRLPKYNPMGPSGPNQEYLYCVSEAAGEKLLQLGNRQHNIERLEQRLTLPAVEPDLPDKLYYPPEQAKSIQKQIQAAINGGKHVVFTGPPGTGKSKLANYVCEQLTDDDIIDGSIFTTATAEWTAYDTVGGYMPSQEGQNEALEFSPGQFLKCFRTDDGDVKSEWLIIDELNRSNIDKAFGQLFSVLSEDSVELPYERNDTVSIEWVDYDTEKETREQIAMNPDRFPVTPKWRLLGTMNTADKTSLYEMSFAFMRRFAFIHVGIPELENEDGDVKAWLLNPKDDSKNYATAWLGVDPKALEAVDVQITAEQEVLAETLEQVGDRIAVLWANINTEHEIGPALIRDIVSYVAAYDSEDLAGNALTYAIISMVYPQLEGLRPDEQKSLVRDLNTPSTVGWKQEGEDSGTSETGPEMGEGGQIDADREVTPGVDISVLKSTAEDMFNIEFDDEQDNA